MVKQSIHQQKRPNIDPKNMQWFNGSIAFFWCQSSMLASAEAHEQKLPEAFAGAEESQVQ